MAISAPRTLAHLPVGQLHQVAALVDHLAAEDGVGIFDQPHHRHQLTLLPEPDSPTMPSTSPRSTVNETPSTAAHEPRLGAERDAEVAHVEQRLVAHAIRTRGSSQA